MKVFIVCLAALFLASAEGLKCPENSRGNHPQCTCLSGGVYDVNYNWCSSDLKELDGECPSDGPGFYPNCNCGLGKTFDRNNKKCTGIDRSVCPKGASGIAPNCKCEPKYAFDEIHWYCRPWYLSTTRPTTTYKPPPAVLRCSAYQYGVYPDCHYKPCPSNALNPQDHEPYCRFNFTYVEYKHCGEGLVGNYPDCYKPCPAYHHGRYPNCERIKCQTGPGWTGQYAPDCKFTPTCPDSHPGQWPQCDIYKATPTYLPPTYLPPTNPPTYLPPTTKARTYLPPQPATYLPPKSSKA
ncbi:adhesive plaque matrix protein-like [Sitodiplosis mosellana]|uniref:adhesive plaque matrix protein-like n=1 Tax=Sitodiplosis mosellana TaxID=263140 RepID=UPI0024446AD2|nr:adhesive plaque matrix protein-like [Sitodiplosis mosellana]